MTTLLAINDLVESLTDPYDVVSSRAFASLVDFTNWSGGTLAEQGVWMAMKGRHPADELLALSDEVLVEQVQALQVPGLAAERCLVWMVLR